MSAPHFVRKIKLDDQEPVRVGGRLAMEDHAALQEVLAEHCGRDTANLFAEPVITRGNGAAPSSISWYAATPGEPVPLQSLDAEARQGPEEALRRHLQTIRPVLDDPEVGPLVRSSLYVASPDDILVLNGKPLLTNWGLAPPGVLAGDETRRRHFDETLGRYALFDAPSLAAGSAVAPKASPGRAAAAGAAAAGAAALGATAMASGAQAAGPAGAAGGAGGVVPPTSGTGLPPGGGGLPPGGPGSGMVVVEERQRPWLGVLIAVIVSALVLVFLLLPGVLLHPPQPVAEEPRDFDREIALQQDINRALEEQIRNTEIALEMGVCRADDASLVLPGMPGHPMTPAPGQALPPAQGQPGGTGPALPPAQGQPGGTGQALPPVQGQPGETGPAQLPSQGQPDEVGVAPPTAPSQADQVGGVQPAVTVPQSVLPPEPSRTVPPTAALPPGQDFQGTLVDLLDAATVFIITTADSRDAIGFGSGFFIGPETVVTNRHVVDRTNAIVVTNESLGSLQLARVVHEAGGRLTRTGWIGRDYAVLRVPGATDVPYLALTPTVSRLQNVIAAGFPMLMVEFDQNYWDLAQGDLESIPEMALSQGVVTVVQNVDRSTPIVAHTAAISSGNSGGPLVDACGRVVGVNTFQRYDRAAGGGRANYAIAAGDLMDFLSSVGVDYAAVEGICSPQRVAAAPAQPEAAAEAPAVEEEATAAEPAVEEEEPTAAEPAGEEAEAPAAEPADEEAEAAAAEPAEEADEPTAEEPTNEEAADPVAE